MEHEEKREPRLKVFQERFELLRKERNLNNTDFAKFLEMSRQTVGFYLNGNRVPDALTLIKIAEKCNVSADWLLGMTDISTMDANVRQICEFTGLTEDTVTELNALSKMGTVISSFLTRYFEDVVVGDQHSIELACICIANAANANAVSKACSATHVSTEVINIMDSINGEHDGTFRISADDAEGYFLSSAQDILKSQIDGIVEQMVEELAEETPEEGVRIWKLLSDEE